MGRFAAVVLVLAVASPASAQTESRFRASVSGGYTDNSANDFLSDDPFGPVLVPSSIVSLGGTVGWLTDRVGQRRLIVLSLVGERYLNQPEQNDTLDFRGRFDLEHTSDGWHFGVRLRAWAADLARYEPEDIVGIIPLRNGAVVTGSGALAIGRDLGSQLRVFNEVSGTAALMDSFFVRDELGLQLALGRQAFEVRGRVDWGQYNSQISDGPYAVDVAVGATAGWFLDLGGGWSTLASGGVTRTRRDNTTFYFARDPGIHVGVHPTARARLELSRGDDGLFLEAARRVKLDWLASETYVASEAVAAGTWGLGSARRILVSAEGGIGRYEPLTEDRDDGLMVRGAAALGWRLSDLIGLGLQYEFLYQEDFRNMRRNTVMLVVAAGDRPRRLHTREELTPLTARAMLSDEE